MILFEITVLLPTSNSLRGTWGAQWVKGPTRGFSSGHDLMVHEFKP